MDFLLRFPDEDGGYPDIGVQGGDLILGDGLLEALWLSFFTDRRAPDTLKIEGDNRRGWWGDALEQTATDRDGRPLGSLFWTLSREKENEETRLKAKSIADDAIDWMPGSDEPAVRDVIAVSNQVWWIRRGVLGIQPTLTLRVDGRKAYRFERGLSDGRARYLGMI